MKLLRRGGVALTIALSARVATAQEVTPQAATARIVRAANAFLATLDSAQRSRVLYAFDDEQQRARWSNFPTGVVPRGGINLRAMTPAQRQAALALVQTALSRRGYEKVQQIMQADEAFKQIATARGSRGAPPGRGPGGPRDPSSLFGSDLYYISILGAPSETAPWMLQYGGHHLALNITIVGARGILTPTLTGAQPSTYTVNGTTVRPLGAESDKALALLNTLNPSQRAQAVLDYRVPDLVLGPGQDGKTIQPEGLRASAMNAEQRQMLLDVIREWAGIINESAAASRMADLTADLGQTYFAWSGATSAAPGQNITAYYRIQGPRLVIEFAPQRDDPALHVHTIYRDPTNDYGRPKATR